MIPSVQGWAPSRARLGSGYGRPIARARARSERGVPVILAVAAFFLFLYFLGEAVDARRIQRGK
jgi:hypothetical protein